MATQDTVIIVGAGPAGLATAYYLQQKGVSFRILERGRVGYAWQHHYDSVRLHTLRAVSGLPGWPMPAHYPDFPTKDHVLAYFRSYADHFEFPVEENTPVNQAVWDGEQWTLYTPLRTYHVPWVILATGIWSTPFVPQFKGQEQFQGEILHANQYRNPKQFKGKRVLVVGAGNTGCEIAVELSELGLETGIVIRNGVAFVDYPTSAVKMNAAASIFRTLPDDMGNRLLNRPDFTDIGIPNHKKQAVEAYPVVGFELPEAVRAGKLPVFHDILELTENGVLFDDGVERPFDTIILATGYRPTVGFVDGVVTLDRYGQLTPETRQHFPQLETVGFHYPATAGWLQSVGRDARRAVDQLLSAQPK